VTPRALWGITSDGFWVVRCTRCKKVMASDEAIRMNKRWYCQKDAPELDSRIRKLRRDFDKQNGGNQ
jgi:hypothetical protein